MIQYHPYSLFLAISALTTLIVFLITRERTAPGSFALSSMLLGMSIWGFAYALAWALVPPGLKALALKIMYVGVVAVPSLFLVFTLRITHRDHWLTFQNSVLLFVEPVIILMIVWFTPHFVFAPIESVTNDGSNIVQIQHGLWFWVNTIYSYAIVLVSFILLISSYQNASSIFKKQYLLIMFGSLIPIGFNIYTRINSLAFSGIDRAPMAFGISAIIYAYAIFRHQFMDLIPIARSRLIENMSDGVLVLDAQGRIVDINPSMETFLEAEPKSFIGRHISEAINIWTESTEHLLTGLETRTEIRLPSKTFRYLDLRVTPLYDEDQKLNGRLIIFRDVTDRKEVEKDLRHAMDRMQTQLIEIGILQSQLREQAIRDALTHLFNRRYLEETLERELARASREIYPLCIVMMDIDHFKDVNDTYGHEAGDLVLKTLAQTVTNLSRQGDFVCRYGGEEFVLVMPNINIDIARERANALHKSITTQDIRFGRFNLSITVSMGLSWFPMHGEKKEDLLRAADRALYAAKHAGRNRVFVYRELENNTE